MNSGLSKKEELILEVIRSFIDRGVPPTVREICSQLGIKSTSTVHRYLGQLQEKGYITKDENLNRSIRLTEGEMTRVPVVGLVTAGSPILAVEQIEQYIPVKTRGDGKDLFALHVRGESMIGAGILDGDIIIARRTSTAENGEIVVAMIDDEATVKRFYKEKGRYRLQPENDTMSPIYTDTVAILGKVVSLYREY
ncbi:transcriptional repressor LexA [Youxingia wuxianensis]|uniref:transcriptional repressor LexA n=1 Tax=Youxingia wuxianensis TaxID=2763678 RepID=UPI0021CCB08B|nr:transcriptional repressor LexA [Youxingia wuxianensis]